MHARLLTFLFALSLIPGVALAQAEDAQRGGGVAAAARTATTSPTTSPTTTRKFDPELTPSQTAAALFAALKVGDIAKARTMISNPPTSDVLRDMLRIQIATLSSGQVEYTM